MNLRAARIILVALLALEIALLIFGPQAKDHQPAIAAAEAADRRPEWWDDAAMGLRYAAWINVALLAVLLASAGSWTRPLPPTLIRTPNSQLPTPKCFWPLVIAAALLTLGLRVPLASKSLWWDEAWVIKEAGHGKWLPDKKREGELRFMAHDWKRCAWYYQKPTNHAPMSLLQKAGITAWQKITGAKRSDFTDLTARVPSLLASMAAVILLACLLRAWGRPGAGVAAAFVLALHPWHMRYGVDARAYALVVPLCISGMFAITRLAETGGRKLWTWLGWGATAFLWLWAFPNAVFDITALNIVAAILLWKSHAEARDRWTALLRLLVTNVFAAILFIQMFLPNLMQARRWAGQEADKHVFDLSLAAETASQLLIGRNLDDISLQLPVLLGSAALVAAALGLILARRRSLHPAVWMLPALVVAAILFSGATSILGSYFYPRFVIALLPVLAAAFSLAFALVGRPLVAGLVACGFIGFWSVPAARLLKFPIAPLHDVAKFVQAESDGKEKPPLIACYGLGREVMPVYEPSCVPLENREDVEALMQRARSEQRSLYIIQGYDSFNRTIVPTGFALLDDRELFEEAGYFSGIEPDFHFHVLRLASTPPK